MPSRRQFIGTSTAAAIGIAAGPPAVDVSAQGAQTAVPNPPVDQPIALTNGRIHTMDAKNTVARAALIRNGRFVAVGNSVATAAGTRVIDLQGRTVVPGLIEAHVHIVSLANRPGYHTILENTTSIREVQEALAARRKDVPEGQWITSMGGWHPNQWRERRRPRGKRPVPSASDADVRR